MFLSNPRGLSERIGRAGGQKTGNVQHGGEIAGCERALRSDVCREGRGPPVAVQHQLGTWKPIDDPRGSIKDAVERNHAAQFGSLRLAKPWVDGLKDRGVRTQERQHRDQIPSRGVAHQMQRCFFSFPAHDPLKGMREGSQGHGKGVLGRERIVEVVDTVAVLGQKSEFGCVKTFMADDPAAAVHIDHRGASRNLRIGFQDFEGFVGPGPITMVDDPKALLTPDPPRLGQGPGCVDRSSQPMQRQALRWAERMGQKMGIDRIRHR